MAGWHHWLNGRESEWTPGFGDGQGGLACCESQRVRHDWATELNWGRPYRHFDIILLLECCCSQACQSLQEYTCKKQNAHNEPASPWPAVGSRYLASASGSSLQEVTPKTWQLNSHPLPPVFLLAACHAVQAVVTPDPSGMSAVFPGQLPPAR